MTRMLDKGTFVGVAILLGAGLATGIVNNLTAGPTRRLEWSRDWPAKGAPNCPQTLPVAGAGAAPEGGAPMAAATGPAMAPTAMPAAMSAAGGPEAMTTAPAATAAAASVPASATAANATAASATAGSATAPSATAPAATPASVTSADVPLVPADKPWIELTPRQVDALFDLHALFVDARLTSQYQEGHVAGAVSIPVWEAGVDEKIAQTVFDVEGDMARPVVTYCNGGECEDSHELGRKFSEAGHTAVYVYRDGYPDWLKRGRPVRTGDAR